MRNPIGKIEDVITQVRVASELNKVCTPMIDKRMMAIAERVCSAPDSMFQPLGEMALREGNRPDSIDHNRTLLGPNFYESSETDERLAYLDFLLPGEVEAVKQKFNTLADETNMFERLKSRPSKQGENFVYVWDHSELANLGYAAGFSHLSAREYGIDSLANHLAVVVGRAVGYFTFNDENVMDGVLRKVGSVIKTFPSGGSESMDEDDQRDLELFRKISNYRTKQEVKKLLSSDGGKIIHIAPSGEEDKFDSKTRQVKMREFGKGTCDLLAEISERATIIPGTFARHIGGSIIEFAEPIEPGGLKEPDDCHAMGQEIAALSAHARGVASVEHPDDDWYKATQIYDLKSA